MALITNLTDYYKLDGNSTDAVGSFNGTDTTITYSGANGKINSGAGLNGTSSFIDLGAVAIGTSFTFNFWFKFSTTGQGVVLSKDQDAGGTTRCFYFNLYNQGGGVFNPGWTVVNAAGTIVVSDVQSATAVVANTWYMLTGTYDTSNAVLYLNGSQTTTTSVSGNANNTANSLLVGARRDSAKENFYGGGSAASVDELGVWSRALTSTEVTLLYNAGAGLQYPFTTASASSGFFMAAR